MRRAGEAIVNGVRTVTLYGAGLCSGRSRIQLHSFLGRVLADLGQVAGEAGGGGVVGGWRDDIARQNESFCGRGVRGIGPRWATVVIVRRHVVMSSANDNDRGRYAVWKANVLEMRR